MSSQARAETSEIIVTGSIDDDRFVLDLAATYILPGGVRFDGMGGLDLLELGGNFSQLVHSLNGPHAGAIQFDGGVAQGDVIYTGLEQITDLITADERIFQDDAGGDDVLTLSDDGDPLNDLSQLEISGSGDSTIITFANPLVSLSIDAGAGDDVVNYEGIDSGYSGSILFDGGSGSDTLAGPDSDSIWTIDGLNSGTLNGIAFSGMESLLGGSGDDLFTFLGGSLTGSIDGGAGANTIDYSNLTSGVAVDLATGAASHTGGISSVDDIIGGGGDDTLTGGDGGAVWQVTGTDQGVIGALGFAGFENLDGGAGDDTFIINAGAAVTGVISGGAGTDSLHGADQSNIWNVAGAGAGDLDGTVFAGMENLLGGILDDNFVFALGGFLTGAVTGGLGQDRVRGAIKQTNWKLFGGGAGNIDGVAFGGIEAIEGGTDADTLVGPDANSTWYVTGPDSGNVGGTTFTGMENLEGAADNEDIFVIEQDGGVSGILEGGDGGFDTVEIAGDYGQVVHTPTGPDSGFISLDGSVLAYQGFEPITNDGNTTDFIFDLSAIATGEFLLAAAGGDMFTLSEVNGGMEDVTFMDPGGGGSVMITLGGGSETITLTGLTGLDASLTIDGGDGDDTYMLDDGWGAVTIVEVDNGGLGGNDDTIDFSLFSGEITISPQGGGGIDITSGANTVTLSSTAADNVETITGADVVLSTDQLDELIEGVELLIGFMERIADEVELGTPLPIIGEDGQEISLEEALGTVEALDELRLELAKFADGGGTLTSDGLTAALDAVFGGMGRTLNYAGAAILAPMDGFSAVDGDVYSFEIDTNVGFNPFSETVSISVATVPGAGELAAGASLEDFVALLNLKLSEADLGDQLLASIREPVGAGTDRFMFQVISTEVTTVEISGTDLAGNDAISKLGFPDEGFLGLTGSSIVLSDAQDVLKNLGDLRVFLAGAADVTVELGGSDPHIRLDLDLRAERISDFGLDFGMEGAGNGFFFPLDETIPGTASMTFDMQLGLTLTDSGQDFFLDVDDLSLGLDAGAMGGTYDLEIGFLGTTAMGDLDLDAGATVHLLKTTAISTSDLLDTDLSGGGALFDPGDSTGTGDSGIEQTDAAGTGTPSFLVDLDVDLDTSLTTIDGFMFSMTIDAGLGPEAVIAGSISNPFDDQGGGLTSHDMELILGGDFVHFLNFTRIDPTGVLTLLGEYAEILDNLRESDLINAVDIPLISGALDKLLGWGEVLSDALLFDDGADDQTDGADRLVTDLNDAFAAAGVDSFIRAQGNGAMIEIISVDPEVRDPDDMAPFANGFTFAAGGDIAGVFTADPGGFAELMIPAAGDDGDGDGIYQTALFTPASSLGRLMMDAVFTVTVNRDGVSTDHVVQLSAADTADNTGIGDDTAKILDRFNKPTFFTAQELRQLLLFQNALDTSMDTGILYDASTGRLSYRIDTPDFDLALFELAADFELDLAPLLGFESNTGFVVSAEGAMDFIAGFDLSEFGLGGVVIDATTVLTDIGVEVKTLQAITADQSPNAVVGRLANDATIVVDLDNGFLDDTLVILASSTTDNLVIGDLINDINDVIATSALMGEIEAVAEDNRIRLREVTPGEYSTLEVVVDFNADPAIQELGFQSSLFADATLAEPDVDDTGRLFIQTVKDAPTAVGRIVPNVVLTADAHFDVSLDGGGAVAVTVPFGDTTANLTVDDLKDDINTAIAGTALAGEVEAVVVNDQIILREVTADEYIDILVTALDTDPAVTELAFQEMVAGNSANDDGELLSATIFDGAAVFSIILDHSGGPTTTEVRIPVTDGADNRSVIHLVGDIRSAFNETKLENDEMATQDLGDFLDVSYQGSRLVLTLKEGVEITGNAISDFVVGAGVNSDDLGFPFDQTSNDFDLIITLSNNTTHFIEFDINDTTVGDILGAIEMQTGGLVQAAISGDDPETPEDETGTRLILTDTTFTSFDPDSIPDPNMARFLVTMINDSEVSAKLGIDSAFADPTAPATGELIGLTIGGTTLSDRFFVSASDPTEFLTAEARIEAGRLVNGISIISEDGTDTVITASAFAFKDAHAAAGGLLLEIKDINGFNSGIYRIKAVDQGLNEATIVKFDVVGDMDLMESAGVAEQNDGVAVLRTGVEASAAVGFVGVELTGTADIGVKIAVGLNTQPGSLFGTDGLLTLNDLQAAEAGDFFDFFDYPELLPHPDILAIDPGNEFGVIDLSVKLGTGSADFEALKGTLLPAVDPRITVRVVSLGDPFIGERFINAGFALDVGGFEFDLTGDFVSALTDDAPPDPMDDPNEFILSIDGTDVLITGVSFAGGLTTVMVDTDLSSFTTEQIQAATLQPVIDIDHTDIEELINFDDVDFSDILGLLQAVSAFLSQFESFEFLSTPLPVVDKSINDLLGLFDDYAQAVEDMIDDPAGTLQLLETKLNSAIAISPGQFAAIAGVLNDNLEIDPLDTNPVTAPTKAVSLSLLPGGDPAVDGTLLRCSSIWAASSARALPWVLAALVASSFRISSRMPSVTLSIYPAWPT